MTDKTRTGWTTVAFGDIAESVNDRVDDPKAAGVDRYVGLEHLDTDSLTIRRWGSTEDVSSTKLRFGPGDIIFGKRRVYQRKLALADFHGICSAHALVLRAKPEAVLPEFLPYFMQSDYFMEAALKISVGSLSPTINWKTLAQYEFELPSLSDQKALAAALRACDQAIAGLQRVPTGSLRMALLSHEFNDPAESWKAATLGDLADFHNGYPFKPSELGDEGQPVVRIKQLLDPFAVPDYSSVQVSERHHINNGDLVMSWSGTLAVRIWQRGPALLNQHLFRVVETEGISRAWLALALELAIRELNQLTHGSTMKHITKTDLLRHAILVPTPSEQDRIVGRLEEVRRSTDLLEAQLADLLVMRKALLIES